MICYNNKPRTAPATLLWRSLRYRANTLLNAFPDVERSDSLRRVEFVACDGEQVHTEITHIGLNDC